MEVNERIGAARCAWTRCCATPATNPAAPADFGDGWNPTLRLEQVRELATAVRGVVDGRQLRRRRTVQGITRGEDLALRSPTIRDVRPGEVEPWLIDPFFVKLEQLRCTALMDLLARLLGSLSRRHRHQPRASLEGPPAVVATRRCSPYCPRSNGSSTGRMTAGFQADECGLPQPRKRKRPGRPDDTGVKELAR